MVKNSFLFFVFIKTYVCMKKYYIIYIISVQICVKKEEEKQYFRYIFKFKINEFYSFFLYGVAFEVKPS